MGTRCAIITNEIAKLAEVIGESNTKIIANYVGMWQTKQDTAATPTADQLRAFVSELKRTRQAEHPSQRSEGSLQGQQNFSFPELTDDQKREEQRKISDYIPEEDGSYDPSIPDLYRDAVAESVVKLHSVFTPQQLSNRIKNVANYFSDVVDSMYSKRLNSLRDFEQAEQDPLKKLLYQQQYLALSDSKNGKSIYISKFLNVDEAIEEVRKTVQRKKDRLDRVITTDENSEKINYIKNQYNKMLETLDLLMVQAVSEIEANEGFRIEISQKQTVQGEVKITGEAELSDSENTNAESEENVSTGNDGWGFKIKMQNPKDSCTQGVKRILRKIPMIQTEAGNEESNKDDIGETRYLDADFVYATILNACSSMIDADDFHYKELDENGNPKLNEYGEEIYHFPVIDKLTEKYKWMHAVQNYLYTDPDLASEFYTAFRLDYTPIYMISNGKFMPINKEMSVANAVDSIIRNYESGNLLVSDSIFDKTGRLNKEHAQNHLSKIDELLTDLSNEDWGDEDYEQLKKILNSLGVEVSVSLFNFLKLDTGDSSIDKMNYQSISKLLSRARTICNSIVEDEVDVNDHLISHFQSEYTDIAKIVGSVTLFNRNLTCRQGDKEYPSYTAPNFITTLVKRLLSTDPNRRQEIFDFYKQDEFFYKDGKWRNFMLQQLEDNKALVETLRDGCLCNMNVMRQTDAFEQSRAIEYNRWSPEMIKEGFIKAYFSIKQSTSSSQQYAYYNLPIFSDTENAMFMKFTRFTGNYKQQIIPLLRQVVYQEFSRQKLILERREKAAATIANFDKTGNRFFFIEGLNDYQSVIDESVIKEYYQNRLQEAEKAGNEKLKDLYTRCLNNLPAAKDGKVTVKFDHAVKAYRDKKDVGGMNAIIDSAIEDLMNTDFKKFYLDKKESFDRLKTSLAADNVIPQEGKEDSVGEYASLDEAVEEYFWNEALIQSQMIEVTTIDPAFYKADGGIEFQKRYKEVYASGRQLDTNSKYGKKFERAIYLKDRITVSRNYLKIKHFFEEAVKKNFITREQKDAILEKYREINNADAQAFRTLSSMRSVLDMLHQWVPETMDSAFERLTKGEWANEDFSVVFGTIKPFLFSIISQDNGVGGKMLVPHQHKDSEFALLAAFYVVEAATGTQTKMRALNKFMTEHDFDVAIYESGVKVGCQNPIDINISEKKLIEIANDQWAKIEQAAKKALGNKYKEGRTKDNFYAGTEELLDSEAITQEEYNGLLDFVEPSEEEIIEILNKACYTENGNINTETVHTFPFSDYMIASPTTQHWVDSKVVDGSQKRNLLPADLPDDPDFRVVVDGKEMSKQQVLDLYNGLIIENLLDDYEEVKESFSDIHKLQRNLLQQIKGNPKYPASFMNALALKNVNGYAEFTIPLDFPSVRNKIAELILSEFKNKITKQKVKGGACILVADTQNRLNIVLEDGTYLNTKDPAAIEAAKKHNFIKGFECYLPAWTKDLYQDYLVKKTKNGKTWQELDIEKLKKEAPELLEMSGIRIPTENKYSITPLIVKGFMPSQNGAAIMLPADITTIVGCDFDVDKMFIRVYRHERDEHGKIKKIKYDYSKSPKEQSRAQRENALLDIELGILRNKKVAESLLSPGSFDTYKKESRIHQILSETSNSGSSLFTIWQDQHNIDYKDIDTGIKSLKEASLSELKKFVDKFSERRSLLSLDSFIYNHQQNMAAAGLIGIYANNTVGQAKCQTTRIGIKDAFTFNMEGRKIKSLHDIYINKNGVAKRVSAACSSISAAAVDAVKDPCLRKLGQNPNTAYIMCLMLRAMDEEEASAIMNQPFVKYIIDNTGKAPNAKQILKHIENLNIKFKTSVDPKNVIQELSAHQFTVQELLKNIVTFKRHFNLTEREIDSINTEERQQFVHDIVLGLLLFNRVARIADAFRGSIGISRADSPNGAVASTLYEMDQQIKRVDEYLAIAGEKDSPLEFMSDIMQNNLATANTSKENLREAFLKSPVPRLQAFYSLGIEFAGQIISPYFMSESPACQAIVSRISAEIGGGRLNKIDCAKLYGDFVTYILSGTETLGDSEEGTFEEKRDYYLYKFPSKLLTILRNNPKLANTPALNCLRVLNGEIVFENSFKITKSRRQAIETGFDSLLYSQNPEEIQLATDLFKYSYYNEGFIPRHNSFNGFFTPEFLSCFDDILSALRKVPDSRTMNNFFEQWVAQKDNMGLFKQILGDNDIQVLNDGSLQLTKQQVPHNYNYLLGNDVGSPYHYIAYNGQLYAYRGEWEKGSIYSPVSTINAGPTEGKMHKFNANKSAAEVASHNPEQDRVDNLKKLNVASFRGLQTASRRSNDEASISTFNNNESAAVTAMSEAEANEYNDTDPSTFDSRTDPDNIPEKDIINNLEQNDDPYNTVKIDQEQKSIDATIAEMENNDYNAEDGQITLIENGEENLC